MKSAYELAMERLAKADPESARPLSAEQKEALRDIESRYEAKIAERSIFLQQALDAARAKGDAVEIEQMEAQIRNEKARLEAEREEEKEAVRNRL